MRRAFANYSTEKDIVERAKRLTVAVVRMVSRVNSNAVRFTVGDQVIRSSGAIGANLVEARYNRSKKDFLSSAMIALKETNETMYWLDILLRLGTVDNLEIEGLLSESEQIAKIISAMVNKVRLSLNS